MDKKRTKQFVLQDNIVYLETITEIKDIDDEVYVTVNRSLQSTGKTKSEYVTFLEQKKSNIVADINAEITQVNGL